MRIPNIKKLPLKHIRSGSSIAPRRGMVVGNVSESAFEISHGLKLHVIVGTHRNCKYNIEPHFIPYLSTPNVGEFPLKHIRSGSSNALRRGMLVGTVQELAVKIA